MLLPPEDRLTVWSTVLTIGGDWDLIVPQARVGTVGVAVGRELKITDQAGICRFVMTPCDIFM